MQQKFYLLLLVGWMSIAWSPIMSQPAIYWSDGTDIYRTSFDGQTTELFITDAYAYGIAANNTHIFWCSHENDTIGRAKLDGTEIEKEFITGCEDPDGIAINATHIFWANYEGNTIGRANLDGSNVEPAFVENAGDGPEGPALNGSYIYWSHYNDENIVRASILTGEIDATFEIDLAGEGPAGVAIQGNYLYWAGYDSDCIGRYNFDTDDLEKDWIPGCNDPWGICAYESYIFWGNYNSRLGRKDTAKHNRRSHSIQKQNHTDRAGGVGRYDGTEANQEFTTASGAVYPIVIVSTLDDPFACGAVGFEFILVFLGLSCLRRLLRKLQK